MPVLASDVGLSRDTPGDYNDGQDVEADDGYNFDNTEQGLCLTVSFYTEQVDHYNDYVEDGNIHSRMNICIPIGECHRDCNKF